MWIRKEGAFDGIVLAATFMAAQEILAERSKKLTDTELLDHLKTLYAECGRLSGFIIDQAPALPGAATYIQRFGSLTRVYELVGYHCPRSTEFLEISRRLRQLHTGIVTRTEHTIAELGGHISRAPKTDLLTLNDELLISLVLARCQTAANGHQRWRIRPCSIPTSRSPSGSMPPTPKSWTTTCSPGWTCRIRKSASATRTAPTSNAFALTT